MGIRASNTETYDFPPTRCTRSYLLASTPRSGGSLLCRTLWEVGAAGAPKAYFDPDQMEELTARFASASARDYTRRLLRLRTSPNGVFGLKADYDHFRNQLLEQNLLGLLPRLRYVKLHRDDRLGQAIAFVRDRRTGPRAADRKSRGEAEFDAVRISKALQKARSEEMAWDRFFAQEGIEPLRVRYEDLAEDYVGTIHRVLDFLGVTPSRPVPPPPLAPQRDARSEEWRRRYLETARNKAPERGLPAGASGNAP